MKWIILLSLVVNTAYADVIAVKKGDPAPDNGYFITVDQEKTFRQINEDNKQLKKVNLELKDLGVAQGEQIALLKQRLTVYQEHNEYLLNRVESAKNDGFWSKSFYFVSGVAVMGGATYLATKIHK